MAELYKSKSASLLSQKMRDCGERFESIVEMIQQMHSEIESLYPCPPSTEGLYSQNFALMHDGHRFILSATILNFFIPAVCAESGFWQKEESASFAPLDQINHILGP